MPDIHYTHTGLGFGFEIPQGWALELESANSRYRVLVSFRAGGARVMVTARGGALAEPAGRAALMKDELAERKIEATAVTEAFSFPGTGNVAAVEFSISGERQRWISLVANGVEFSFTHTGPYEAVRSGLERMAATFRLPDAEQARRFLLSHAATTPFQRAEELEGLSHFQRVAARFNVPTPPKRPKGSS